MTPSLADLERRYELTRSTISAGGRELTLVHPRSTDDLLDEAAFNRDGRIPYWADVWAAARVLADEIMRSPGCGQRVLELGSGVGAGAIAASAAGYDVTASDYYPEALEFVALNAHLNGVPPPQTMHLDWRAWPEDLLPFAGVIAADVVYEPQLGELVASAIERALLPGGWALVTDPQRRHAPGFVAACRARGLQLAAVETRTIEHRGVAVAVDLYRVQKRHSA